MQRFGMMTRVIAVVLGVTLAIAALASASAQQGGPPHTFYGTDATPGDEIAAVVSHGDHYDTLDVTTVGDDGRWSLEVEPDMVDEVVFTVNGEHAEADITPRGAGLDEVTLTVAMVEDSMDDDSMMEDGDDSMMEDDDSMMEDDDDSMMEDDSMEDDDEMLATAPPTTGTGGLADNGGISAGLIGLLIALGAAAVAGIGVRRVRNRA